MRAHPTSHQRDCCNNQGNGNLTAWEGNAHALGFYVHMGYRALGRTMHVFEGRGYGNVVLARALREG